MLKSSEWLQFEKQTAKKELRERERETEKDTESPRIYPEAS